MKQMSKVTSCSSSSTESSNQLRWNLNTNLRNCKSHDKIRSPNSKNLNLKILYHKIKPKIVAKKKGKEINYGEKIEKLTLVQLMDSKWRTAMVAYLLFQWRNEVVGCGSVRLRERRKPNYQVKIKSRTPFDFGYGSWSLDQLDRKSVV